MDIYLLRHGETDWNKKGLLQGHTDIPLNEKGKAQVETTVRKLNGLKIRMDAVIASPLKRARESAEIAARLLDYPRENVLTEILLTERGFGEGEGLTVEEREERYPDCSYPGMESQEDLVRRAGRAFEKAVCVFPDAERILLVAHGAILFAMLEAVSKEPIPYDGRAACITQGSIYRIHKEGSRICFAGYDEKADGFVEMDAAGIGRSAKIYL